MASHVTTSDEKIKNELDKFKKEFNFIEPNRGNLDDPTIKWLHGRPIYDKANLEYFKGKSMNHKADSLHKLVEDLVKTWEMEASHKVDFSQWQTIDHDNYKISANGGKFYYGEDAKRSGNYNILFEGCKKELYDNEKEDFESSHNLFRNSFLNGFAWELIELFSLPPKVAFSWRHWGVFDGVYRGNVGNNQTIEMYGFCVVEVNENLKIKTIEVYYKPNEFLEALEGKRDHNDLMHGKTIIGPGCPFSKDQNNNQNNS